MFNKILLYLLVVFCVPLSRVLSSQLQNNELERHEHIWSVNIPLSLETPYYCFEQFPDSGLLYEKIFELKQLLIANLLETCTTFDNCNFLIDYFLETMQQNYDCTTSLNRNINNATDLFDSTVRGALEDLPEFHDGCSIRKAVLALGKCNILCHNFQNALIETYFDEHFSLISNHENIDKGWYQSLQKNIGLYKGSVRDAHSLFNAFSIKVDELYELASKIEYTSQNSLFKSHNRKRCRLSKIFKEVAFKWIITVAVYNFVTKLLFVVL